MEARYKILFSGDFKEWVLMGEFIESFSLHLGVDRIKAGRLLLVNRETVLKMNLTEIEAKRHMIAFEKMGMRVSKRLMMKPFVGPRLDFASMDQACTKPVVIERSKKGRAIKDKWLLPFRDKKE